MKELKSSNIKTVGEIRKVLEIYPDHLLVCFNENGGFTISEPPESKGTNDVDVSELAKYILQHLRLKELYINNIMLQRILYLIQLKYLELNNSTLFDEKVIAVKFGPEIEKVYYEYSSYGTMPIYDSYPNLIEKFRKKYNCIDIDWLDAMIIELGQKATNEPLELIEKVHKEGDPWDIAYRDIYNKVIIF